MNSRTKKILGPPGTGKTTTLIEKVEYHIMRGIKPEEICYVSFTKKAANEARERVMKKFGLEDVAIPYFRTLHSLAFHYLGLEKKDVMSFMNYLDICKLLGLSISSVKPSEDSWAMSYYTKGDRMFFLENLARATKKTLAQVVAAYINDDIPMSEMELLETTINDYKRIHNKIDFTDMIQMFVKAGASPKIKVLIVDEAQDLSALQWDMVKILANVAQFIYVAGDDDQAIYSWAGADVQQFQDMEVLETSVLKQSYRIPSKVFDIANNIISKVQHRNTKMYYPTPDVGQVMLMNNLEELDLAHGTWLLLARNITFLQEYAKYCVEKGYLFESKHMPVINTDAQQAVLTWETLRKGEPVTVEDALAVYDLMKTKTHVAWGSKKKLAQLHPLEKIHIDRLVKEFGLLTNGPWYEAMGHIDTQTSEFFKLALKKGERMLAEPRIKISTIHGVKGGEAENVVIIPDMSPKTYDEFQTKPDDEHRVWYVAVTRTKQNLWWMSPRTSLFYNL
jgi:DNA helicase-2/ATP-dependent DNA helicase PcrA